MGSKFRPLYDKLYMQIEYLQLAFTSNKRIKQRERIVNNKHNLRQGGTTVDRQYREKVLPYWKKYGIKPKKRWYKVFSELSGEVNPRFIPHDILVKKVFPYYNALIYSKTFQDKNYQDVYLSGFSQPETLVRNISGTYSGSKYELLSEDEAVKCCFKEKKIIIKPSVGTGSADGIRFVDLSKTDFDGLRSVFCAYKRDFVVQKLLKQHEAMASLHAESINTIRILTFLHDGKVDIINSFLRIGAGNSKVDNFSKGGYACNIQPNGKLSEYALDNQYNWVKTSDNGIVFGEFTIPSFEKVVDIVKRAALRLTHFRIIGWDIAIDANGEPVIIEYNLIPITSVDLPQNCCNNPYFGDLTEQVLTEVFLKEHEK